MPLPAPHGSWLKPAYTRVTQTLVTCENPLLVVDDQDTWSVRLPALARMTGEISWQAGQTPGRDTPLSEFYIARPDRDTAAFMNAQLAQGKHLLLTPGIYDLTEPLRVSRANTLVLGLGFATLRPTRGAAAILTSDVDGVMIAGLLFEAGPQLSPVLLQVGAPTSHLHHAANPPALFDFFLRVSRETGRVSPAFPDL